MPDQPKQQHLIGRIGWLRAAVLGANDGILSTASLVLGVASAQGTALIPVVAGASLAFLAIPGGPAANAGGARITVGAMRVAFRGALAMAVTAGVGALFGTVV